MNKKEQFLSRLRKKLNASQKLLLPLIEIVGVGKASLVFKMPKGVVPLVAVWEKIEKTAEELGLEVSQTSGEYATLEDLDKIMGEISWLWKNWVPRGMVTMLAGDPGVGKSAIVQHLTKIVTCAECFPLEEEPLEEPGNVIWVDTEASQQILKVRANTMQLDKKRVYIPAIDGDMLTQPDLTINSNRDYLVNMIEELKPALFVLDSLGGSHTRGENKVEDIKPVLEFLALLARDNNMATIVIHHLNKGHKDESPEVSLYRIRGSTVIPAMCRSIFAIEPTHDKKLRLRIVKTNIARPPDPIGITPLLDRDGEFKGFTYEHYVPPPGKQSKKEVVAEWVLSQLRTNKKGMALTELIELGIPLGFTRGNIYAARDVLGNQLFFSGTGNKAFWHTYLDDVDTIQSIKNMIGNGNGKTHKEVHNAEKAKSKRSSRKAGGGNK